MARPRSKAAKGASRSRARAKGPRSSSEEALLRRLGERVKNAREASGLTQEAAAARAKIDYKRWQRIERGKVNPTVSTVLRVSDALNVEPWSLLAPKRRDSGKA